MRRRGVIGDNIPYRSRHELCDFGEAVEDGHPGSIEVYVYVGSKNLREEVESFLVNGD